LRIQSRPGSNGSAKQAGTEAGRTRILFFIGNLRLGGKERRLVELLKYLSRTNRYELLVVLAFDQIELDDFYQLNIEHIILGKQPKSTDLSLFVKLDRIARDFQPDIIHAWGSMPTFYLIPASLLRRVPLVNSQITNAKPAVSAWSAVGFINRLNFLFSSIVVANSCAGLKAYRMEGHRRAQVIYNGMDLARFQNLPDSQEIKKNYRIMTPYTVVMVAAFTRDKDFRRFYEMASFVTEQRADVTFVGVGGPYKSPQEFDNITAVAKSNPRILFPGHVGYVEPLVNACDIGVLFTNAAVHGEGISNTILEYMALGKPVIANDTGGTGEIVRNNQTGYLVGDQPIAEIAGLIVELLDQPEKRVEMGRRGRQIVRESFTLEKMGREFESLYHQILDS